MADKNTLPDRLSTWKEISVYLDCDIRTCQRYERKLGLPVHRLDPCSSKSRVYTYRSELDEWLKKGFTTNSFQHQNRQKKKKYFFLLITAALFLLIILLNMVPGSTEPFNFDIKNSKLLILNEKNKKLWSFDTGLSNLSMEKKYRQHFQKKKVQSDDSINLPHLLFKDLNQNGKKEVLFTTQTLNEEKEGLLFCFDHKGNKLWEFKPGKKLKFGSTTYSADYRIKGIGVYDINRDGSMEILVIAKHLYYFPCQILILNLDGEILGEFWNSGYLVDYIFYDFNEVGQVELVFSGSNNEYDTGCLIVFDPLDIRGASPQSEKYRCKKFGPGSEKFYILIPPTDIEVKLGNRNTLDDIRVLSNEIISVRNRYYPVYYEFNFDCKLININFSDEYERMHEKYLSENKITSSPKKDYKKSLMQRLLYYDGQNWLSNPTAVSPISPTPAQ